MIPVVGFPSPAGPDPIGNFTIVARDFSNLPIDNELVTIDSSACVDMRLCIDPHDPLLIVDCVARTIRKRTGPNGEVKFRVIGCGIVAPGTPGSVARCAIVSGGQGPEGSRSAAVYDLNGYGLAPADLSAWLADYFSPAFGAPRDDYDGNGTVGPADQSLWLGEFFSAESVDGCSSTGRCP